MAKENFQRTKPHVTSAPSATLTIGKSTLTAALVEVQARKGFGDAHFPTRTITKGGTVRDETKTVTIAVSHVEYQSDKRHLCAR